MSAPALRVGFDAQLLATPTPSGVEQTIARTLRGLLEQDDTDDYVLYGPPSELGPMVRDPRRQRIAASRLGGYGRLGRIVWQQAWLPRRLRTDRVDVLHAPGYVAPLRLPCPLVLTIYDVLAIKRPDLCKGANALHYRLLMPRSARRAKRILVPTDYVRKDVVECLGVEETRVETLAPPMRPMPALSRDQAARSVRDLKLPESYILFLGNIEPKKNVAALVRAYAALRREHRIEHKLVLAGRWAWKFQDVLDAIAEEGVENEVVRLGYVPDPMVPALYTLADVFVFPSIEEGLGFPPLEAMACGTPVVTSDAAALPEVVGRAAITAPPDDIRQIKTAIHKILTNQFLRRTLKRMGQNHARALSQRSPAQRLVEIYQEVCLPRNVENDERS